MNFIKNTVLLLGLSASYVVAMEGDMCDLAGPKAPPAHVLGEAPVQETTWNALPEELIVKIIQHATSGDDGRQTYLNLLATNKETRRIALNESFINEKLWCVAQNKQIIEILKKFGGELRELLGKEDPFLNADHLKTGLKSLADFLGKIDATLMILCNQKSQQYDRDMAFQMHLSVTLPLERALITNFTTNASLKWIWKDSVLMNPLDSTERKQGIDEAMRILKSVEKIKGIKPRTFEEVIGKQSSFYPSKNPSFHLQIDYVL